jgi:hypothetical protein
MRRGAIVVDEAVQRGCDEVGGGGEQEQRGGVAVWGHYGRSEGDR